MGVTTRGWEMASGSDDEKVLARLDDVALTALERTRRPSSLRRRAALMRRALRLADVSGLVAAFVVTEAIFGNDAPPGAGLSLSAEIALIAIALPAWIVAATAFGLYDRDGRGEAFLFDDVAGVFHLVVAGAWIAYLITIVTDVGHPQLEKLGVFSAFALGLVAVARTCARATVNRNIAYAHHAIVVGHGAVGQRLASGFVRHPEFGVRVVGFVDQRRHRVRHADLEKIPYLGDPSDLLSLVRLFHVERIVIAFWDGDDSEILHVVRSLRALNVHVDIAPRFYEVVPTTSSVRGIQGFPIISIEPVHLSRSSKIMKRIVDVTVSSVALIILLPFFGLVALLIKLDSPGPVFFRQRRVGKDERRFEVLKFRSMHVDADSPEKVAAHREAMRRNISGDLDERAGELFGKVKDDPRVTRIGSWMRRYSVDEWPQVINVLRGEMSLIGPRPPLPYEVEMYADWHRARFHARPGITGLWQVSGRNRLPFQQMVQLDVYYIENWSLWLDIKILLKTIPVVLRGDNTN